MADRDGLFAGDDPFEIARRWLAEAEKTEPNDPNAIALSTVDPEGMPDARMVLLKAIEGSGTDGSFVFYTNYESAKGRQIAATGKAAFVMHWKSLRRQIRVRGTVTREEGPQADEYYASRALQSRIGAWASKQSRPLASRGQLLADVAKYTIRYGNSPTRPPSWGGLRIHPVSIEFWAEGAFRLHDRFVWDIQNYESWAVQRLYP
ncbi:pyridoxamine 5'-phosphate oxidase [Paracoccus sp. 11-3]|uniref:Pyridoxine/pyridoxamine 5'-phosphate oxidase n=1 Tax=Paracoccus amoyensis TaxID=2760093 RepID=A0A926G8Y3_9RHOB|nr:pyridoxamine 5'-phosphate oxidase [Paracoccus amoyensis]MBC9245481.1 pyridoxamine 5'-phosphate oxidase [Paracoccus amoyensis]